MRHLIRPELYWPPRKHRLAQATSLDSPTTCRQKEPEPLGSMLDEVEGMDRVAQPLEHRVLVGQPGALAPSLDPSPCAAA